jgi:hypothetical protein
MDIATQIATVQVGLRKVGSRVGAYLGRSRTPRTRRRPRGGPSWPPQPWRPPVPVPPPSRKPATRRSGSGEGHRERERERDPPDSPEGGWEGRKRNLDFEEGSRLERRLLGLEVVTVWEEIFAIIGFEHAASPLHGRGSVTQGYYYLLR